ncbi:hypothetical protein [Maribacter litoralis]|uniref:hypothetical protein n=1 Tax=Maribacter litoralis TaxID=2059726 RepID=UPI000C47C597|nr:hypothetical protein [Allomuricauda sp.]|tara:strand:- start:17531 stop:18019 length:489 start_codon:yes stop_codon:yes gene_type:complete
MLDITLKWVKGEINDAIIFGLVGAALLVTALFFFKASGFSKHLAIPLLIASSSIILISISNIWVNKKRLTEFTTAYDLDKDAFHESEIERVQGFQSTYKYSAILLGTSIFIGFLLFVGFTKPSIKAIGLILILFGLIGGFIDFYSLERATTYQKSLNINRVV